MPLITLALCAAGVVWNPSRPEMHRSGQPESGKYKPGDTLIIVAASISKPAPIVRWIKDGNYLDLDVDRGTNPKAKNHDDESPFIHDNSRIIQLFTP